MVLEGVTLDAYCCAMTRRYTAVGLVLAFVLGAVLGALLWDKQVAERTSAPPASQSHRPAPRSPSQTSTSTSPSESPARVGSSDDLLDVVRAVETLDVVSPCHMVEMFAYQPLSTRAFCATSVGDELRINYQNQPTSHEDDVTAFCDQLQGEGQGFYLSGTRWGLVQVAADGTPDEELTNDLAAMLEVSPVQCGG